MDNNKPKEQWEEETIWDELKGHLSKACKRVEDFVILLFAGSTQLKHQSHLSSGVFT